MARKKAGFYNEDPISGSAFQLIIELDEQEMRCMSKTVDNGTIVAFEYLRMSLAICSYEPLYLYSVRRSDS